MKTNTRKSAVVAKPFIVEQDWQSITATVSGADLAYLEGEKQAGPLSLGQSIWFGIEVYEGSNLAAEVAEFADVSDPVEITFEVEDRLWSGVLETCKANKCDLAAAIRFSLRARVLQIQKFKRTKARRVA